MPNFEEAFKNKVGFQSLVRQELEKVRSKIPPFNSLHEVYGVLMEEVAEFFDEVRKHREERAPEAVLEELVQVAGIAQRACEDFEICGPSLDESDYKIKYEELKQHCQEFHKMLVSRATPLINRLQPDRIKRESPEIMAAVGRESGDRPYSVNLLQSEIETFGEKINEQLLPS